MHRLKQSVFLRKLRASLFCLPLLSLFLLPQLFFGYLVPQKTSTEVIHTSAGDVTHTEYRTDNPNFTQYIRIYKDAQNTAVRTDRFLPEGEARTHESKVLTVTGGGTLRTYDCKANKWSETPLRAGTYPKGMYFVRADGCDSIIVTPLAYRDRGTGMIEYLPGSDGTLEVTETRDGFALSVKSGSVPAGAFSDSLALTSEQLLFDWNDSDTLTHWQNYRFTDDNRWCFDGYSIPRRPNTTRSATTIFTPSPAPTSPAR